MYTVCVMQALRSWAYLDLLDVMSFQPMMDTMCKKKKEQKQAEKLFTQTEVTLRSQLEVNLVIYLSKIYIL